MDDRLTDIELNRLDTFYTAATMTPWEADRQGRVTATFEGATGIRTEIISESSVLMHAGLIADIHKALPALLDEVREYRTREATRKAALDALVDGDHRHTNNYKET